MREVGEFLAELALWFAKGVFWTLAPLLLILAGGSIAGWGLHLDSPPLVWAGLIAAGAGVIWGLVVYFFIAEGGSWGGSD